MESSQNLSTPEAGAPERKKKVLFVVTKSNFGGAQRYVYDLATRLASDHYAVAVAFGVGAEGQAGKLSRLLIDEGIQTIVIPEMGRDISLLKDFQTFRALTGIFAEEKPDIVHLNSSKAGGIGAFAARMAGIPRIIFTVHGLPYDEDRSWWERALIASLTWVSVILSHHTIAVSHDNFERLIALPFLSGRVFLVPNGIAPLSPLSREEARAQLGTFDATIPHDGKLVGMIAEMHPNKDIRLALDAISLMPDTHLCLIGDGEEKNILAAYAEEKHIARQVHFLGYIENAAQLLTGCDVFLLTSKKEGLPYVLLEAGSLGIPVVAVDIAGVRDIIERDVTGALVPRDAHAVAKQLTHVLTDASYSKAIADALKIKVGAEFQLDRMVKATLSLYEAVG